jgi:hypothetical protein
MFKKLTRGGSVKQTLLVVDSLAQGRLHFSQRLHILGIAASWRVNCSAGGEGDTAARLCAIAQPVRNLCNGFLEAR